jgi:hypothetical protein
MKGNPPKNQKQGNTEAQIANRTTDGSSTTGNKENKAENVS